eukprot:4462275-Karenia_brevis.AAC.1
MQQDPKSRSYTVPTIPILSKRWPGEADWLAGRPSAGPKVTKPKGVSRSSSHISQAQAPIWN